MIQLFIDGSWIAHVWFLDCSMVHGSSWKAHGCFMDTNRFFMNVSWMVHVLFMDGSWMVHGRFMNSSWKFHG
jgi:hypothetical protein